MLDFAAIWLELLGGKPAREAKGRQLYEEKVKLLSRLPGGIANGEPCSTLSREELERLLAGIRQRVTARNYVFLVRFLARGLQNGKNQLGWDVAIPAIPVTIPSEPSRFNPDKFVALNRLRSIERCFLDSMKEFTRLTTRQRLGMLLFSAVLNGGLLQKQWLAPWLAALKDRIRIHGACLWMEMEQVWHQTREKREKEDADETDRSTEKSIIINRRWIADPQTRAIITQWLNLPDEMRNIPARLGIPYDYIKCYLLHARVPRDKLPRGIGDLLDMAETRIGLNVSPFLASYATGKIKGVSIPAESWARLMSSKAVPRQSAAQDAFKEEGSMLERRVCNSTEKPLLSDQQPLLRQIRRIIHGNKGAARGNAAITKELTSFILKNERNLSPLLIYLTEWSRSLLRKTGGLRPSTVYRYLTAIGGYLLVVCETEEILDFDSQEYEECYERVIELIASENEKNFALIPLSNFHEFLISKYQAPKLQSRMPGRRSCPPEKSVDANLVSQLEFDRLKTALGWKNANRPRTATAALLLAILGFRCGLRRNEARFLRIRDIQGRHRPELILRTTSKRRLKSRSSTRRLPLHVLLPPEELMLLMDWVEKHDTEDREALVFSIRGMRHQALPESVSFKPIAEALALVTGDASLRYHHLRHSFLTWLIIRIAGSTKDLHNAAPFLEHPEFHKQRVMEIRAALLGNEHLGRKGAYAVSCLSGHSNLETSFTSYIHICDWLLGRELSLTESLPDRSIRALSAATGLPKSTVQYLLKPSNNEGSKMYSDWDRLFLNCANSFKECVDPHIAAGREPSDEAIIFEEDAEGAFSWEKVQQTLTMHQVKGADLEEISNKLAVGMKDVASWTENADRLADLKTRYRGNNIYRKDLKVLQKPQALKEQNARIARIARKSELSDGYSFRHHDMLRPHPDTGRIVFPVFPPFRRDQEQAARFLEAFLKLDSSTKREVIYQAEYFTETYLRAKNMLVFTEVGKVRRFVNAIKAIGVKNEMLRLLQFPEKGESLEKKMSMRLAWEKELAVSGCRWGVCNSNYGKWRTFKGEKSLKKHAESKGFHKKDICNADYGTIGIQVTGRLKEKRTDGGFSKSCFLYAIYMIDIARTSFIGHSVADDNP